MKKGEMTAASEKECGALRVDTEHREGQCTSAHGSRTRMAGAVIQEETLDAFAQSCALNSKDAFNSLGITQCHF